METCRQCGREFNSYNSVVAHLKSCPEWRAKKKGLLPQNAAVGLPQDKRLSPAAGLQEKQSHLRQSPASLSSSSQEEASSAGGRGGERDAALPLTREEALALNKKYPRELNAFERIVLWMWLRGSRLSEAQMPGLAGAMFKLQVADEEANEVTEEDLRIVHMNKVAAESRARYEEYERRRIAAENEWFDRLGDAYAQQEDDYLASWAAAKMEDEATVWTSNATPGDAGTAEESRRPSQPVSTSSDGS